ncbi:hypothetical protein [Heyndrickxia coagulans]|uniref:hypothetical protein n=1 Tax=Heyndrickxia coagulans TaxID=1398 RepID=UPI0008F801D3|nr:hypothetical protein [Heyndrickxia coagulans]APB37964.1 hypothetical protein BIZ35_15170 [Heyndrickxia coagulans]WNE61786.1 hypothetical protein KIY57_01175 [Heyndrickxia coagulans]
MEKKCEHCGGQLIESSECWVLSDGYEVPIYKCKDCGEEARSSTILRNREVTNLKINRKRKRAIEKAEREMEILENWKEHVLLVGGSLRKDRDGKYYGVAYFD